MPRIAYPEQHAVRPSPTRGRRLPPLDALHAFESAARHLSFTRAAEEIRVTQAAVSHRVRELELRLEARLFRRLTRRIELTEQGEVLALAVRRGLDHIAHGMAAIGRDPESARPVRVSVLPSFAQRWLVPRLPRFQAWHPDVDVQIIAEARLSDLYAGAADLAVRFGRGSYPGLRATFLMGDAVLPVCSPGFLRSLEQPDPLERVLRQPLLHDSGCVDHASGEDWSSWLAHTGRPDLRCDAGARFSNATLTVGAAAAGLGIGLGRRSLIENDLAAGRLVPAWPDAAPTAFSYWIVCVPERLNSPGLVAFQAWLLGEASGSDPAGTLLLHRDVLS